VPKAKRSTKSAEKPTRRPQTATSRAAPKKIAFVEESPIVEEPRFMMPSESEPVIAAVAKEESKQELISEGSPMRANPDANTSGLIRGLESHLSEYVPQTRMTIAREFQKNSLPSSHKFRNADLEEKTAALQAEFDALLGARQTSSKVEFIAKDESFYSTMSEFYSGHKKHESPTRRLMNQMDAACENKSVI